MVDSMRPMSAAQRARQQARNADGTYATGSFAAAHANATDDILAAAACDASPQRSPLTPLGLPFGQITEPPVAPAPDPGTVTPVWDTSRHYAEAALAHATLTDTHGVSTGPTLDDLAAAQHHAAYKAWVDNTLIPALHDADRDDLIPAAQALTDPAFDSRKPHDETLQEPIRTWIVQRHDRRNHPRDKPNHHPPIVHEDPDCTERASQLEPVELRYHVGRDRVDRWSADGSRQELLTQLSQEPTACRCCTDQTRAALTYVHRDRTVGATRRHATRVLEDLAAGRAVNPDDAGALWAHSDFRDQNWDASQHRKATIKTISDAATAQAAASGTRTSVTFDATVLTSAKRLAQSTTNPKERDTLTVVARHVRNGTPLDQLADRITDDLDGPFTRRSKVRSHVEPAVRKVLDDASTSYAHNQRAQPTERIVHVDAIRSNRLLRRIAGTYPTARSPHHNSEHVTITVPSHLHFDIKP